MQWIKWLPSYRWGTWGPDRHELVQRGQIRIWTEVSLNPELSHLHQSAALATSQDDTSTTHFPPGCVTVDWIFASVPVLLRDTWTPAGPRGWPLLRTCRGEGGWTWPRSKVLLSRDPAPTPHKGLRTFFGWKFLWKGDGDHGYPSQRGLRGCEREQ